MYASKIASNHNGDISYIKDVIKDAVECCMLRDDDSGTSVLEPYDVINATKKTSTAALLRTDDIVRLGLNIESPMLTPTTQVVLMLLILVCKEWGVGWNVKEAMDQCKEFAMHNKKVLALDHLLSVTKNLSQFHEAIVNLRDYAFLTLEEKTCQAQSTICIPEDVRNATKAFVKDQRARDYCVRFCELDVSPDDADKIINVILSVISSVLGDGKKKIVTFKAIALVCSDLSMHYHERFATCGLISPSIDMLSMSETDCDNVYTALRKRKSGTTINALMGSSTVTICGGQKYDKLSHDDFENAVRGSCTKFKLMRNPEQNNKKMKNNK